MKIALYVDNRKINDVDCSDLLKGNPGIGGTEYSILLLAQVLEKNSFDVILLLEKRAIHPEVSQVRLVNRLDDVVKIAKEADILIISSRRDGEPLGNIFFEQLNSNNIRTIIWGHNYYYSDYAKRIAACNAIKANVFVGRQQYDRYIDHEIIKKSTYIYNMYPINSNKRRDKIKKHYVTYIGSLVPEKGFHVLAAAWKKVIASVPDAELNVIGSGKLYSRASKLGKFGIAEESYENQFMPYLVDSNSNIIPSVHFYGVMGAEKADVIINSSVGVVNPTGRTETFGISALDFESMGVPVVTISKGGFLDTIINKKTGILCENINNISGAIIELLKDDKKNTMYGTAAIELSSQFAPDKIIIKWEELFYTILNEDILPYYPPENFIYNNLKWLRIANHNIKELLHINGGPSVIGLETLVRKVLRRLGC